ncbi:hypothetical protein [Thetidibacter halocola]|nr:hypothetical protein [Thetidibacter halocola]
MIKTGASKLALDCVPSMARALKLEPAYLMHMAIEGLIAGNVAQEGIAVFGTLVIENETTWLEALREVSNETDPRLTARAWKLLFAVAVR